MLKTLKSIPLPVIPLLIYNIVVFATPAAQEGQAFVWDRALPTIHLLSGGQFTLTLGDLLTIFGLIFLFIEIIKSTRASSQEIYEHMFSMGIFIIYLVEFITVARCAHSVFFILTTIALIDVVAGFMVTIGTSRRQLNVERDTGL